MDKSLIVADLRAQFRQRSVFLMWLTDLRGTGTLMVTAGPRDLTPWDASKAEPVISSLNDAQGRAKLGAPILLKFWQAPEKSVLLRRL